MAYPTTKRLVLTLMWTVRQPQRNMPLFLKMPPGSGLIKEQADRRRFSHGSRADVASALTEADIYLAYRRYGPAEELIKQAIDGNPENMILKAKLLEIYAYRKDKNKFVTAMEQVYQSMIARSPEIWAKVVEMGG